MKVKITDRAGRPIPNIRVALNESEDAPRFGLSAPQLDAPRLGKTRFTLEGITLEDGMLTLEPVWAGRSLVWVTPNMQGDRQETLGIEPRSRTLEVVTGREDLLEWTAATSALLSGRATARGRPLANTMLSLLAAPQSGWWYPVRAKTDAEGAFTFPAVPIGNYFVRRGDYAIHFDIAARVYEAAAAIVIPNEWAARYWHAGRPVPGDAEHSVTLRDGANSADFDFGNGNRLEIGVVDSHSQQSIPRAAVRVYAPLEVNAKIPRGHARRFPEQGATGKPTLDRRGATGSDGKVAFEDIPGGMWRVSVQAPGRRRAQLDAKVPPSDDGTLVIPIDRGGVIRGKVVSSDGTPAPSAIVALVPAGDDLEPVLLDATIFETAPETPRAFTRDDGTFELAGLPAGIQRFVAYSSTHAPATVDLTIPEAGPMDDVVITLERFGGFVVSAHRGADVVTNYMVTPKKEGTSPAIPPEAWEDDGFFGLVGGLGDPMSARGGPAPKGVVTLERIPPGEYTLEIAEPAAPGAAAKPSIQVKARAVAGRNVPIYVELP